MGHYDDLREEEYLQERQRRKKYLIGMIKSGKYDQYLNFCHSNNFQTVQVPLSDFSMMINIIQDLN